MGGEKIELFERMQLIFDLKYGNCSFFREKSYTPEIEAHLTHTVNGVRFSI